MKFLQIIVNFQKNMLFYNKFKVMQKNIFKNVYTFKDY